MSVGLELPDRASSQARPSLCLVISGEAPLAAPARWPLDAIDVVVIGRGAETAAAIHGGVLRLAVADRHVSTTHARLCRAAGGWTLEDTISKNGTSLNGEPCQRAHLGDGDVIAVGATCLLFEQHRGELAPAPRGAAISALATFAPEMMAIRARLAAVARSDLPVMLLGETGAGKEVMARGVHDASGRRGPFVGVNCGALPPTLLEATLFGHRRGAFTGAVDHQPGLVRRAHQGTLFLDEIGELSAAGQVALLRVLQEREVIPVGETEPVPVTARIVAATNRDLHAEVLHGRFREDLLARLAGLVVRVPPLRERRADLGILVGSLLARLAPEPGAVRFTTRAVRALLDHDWPQNVRELEMCLRSAGELAGWGTIDLHHLPPSLHPRGSAGDRRDELAGLLEAHRGSIAAVARELRTSRAQVHRLLRRFELDHHAFRE